MAYNYFSKSNFQYFWSKLWTKITTALNLKYDKTGGEITGTVKVDGNLVLDIEDEDYDSGITFTKALDDNLGTILTLSGYANANGNNTSYRPIIRNVNPPNADYDVANKKYVDENTSVPTFHLVDLNIDGSVGTFASTLVYRTVLSNLTNPKEDDYLDCFWENGQGSNSYTRFQAYTVGVTDVNTGNIMFEAELFYMGYPVWMVFSLDKNSVLTTTAIMRREDVSNKTTDIVANSTSHILYPTAKAVFDQFQRKPVVVWEVERANGHLATGSDITADMSNWQVTGLDLSPYKAVELYIHSGGTGSSLTPSAVIKIDLAGDNQSDIGGHYVGGVVLQNPNNRNRLIAMSVAVKSDKTAVIFNRCTSLYGTAATGANDSGRVLYKIVGYYD